MRKTLSLLPSLQLLSLLPILPLASCRHCSCHPSGICDWNKNLFGNGLGVLGLKRGLHGYGILAGTGTDVLVYSVNTNLRSLFCFLRRAEKKEVFWFFGSSLFDPHPCAVHWNVCDKRNTITPWIHVHCLDALCQAGETGGTGHCVICPGVHSDANRYWSILHVALQAEGESSATWCLVSFQGNWIYGRDFVRFISDYQQRISINYSSSNKSRNLKRFYDDNKICGVINNLRFHKSFLKDQRYKTRHFI